jgi:putative copper resistance protein D
MDPSCDCQMMPVPWALVAVRAVHFAACLLVFGLAGYDRLVASPVARRDRGAAPSEGLDRLAMSRRSAWVILALLAVVLASGAAWLVLVAGQMAEMPPLQAFREGALRVVWEQTRVGRAWQLRAACWGAAFAAAAVLAVIPLSPRWRGAMVWLLLIFTGGMTGGLAWGGHGLVGEGTTGICHSVADVLHLVVSGIWPVGLLPFAISLRRLGKHPLPGGSAVTAALVRRFSAVSLISVAALTVTGFVNSWVLVGTVGALFHTRYGQTLVVKLGLFILMFGFGAINLLVLKPRIGAGPLDRHETALRRLRFSIAGELFLGTLIVLIVALLGMLAPAAG